jgi:hypothetical protein
LLSYSALILRPEDLKALKAHVLVVVGDADIIRPEQVEFEVRFSPHMRIGARPC